MYEIGTRCTVDISNPNKCIRLREATVPNNMPYNILTLTLVVTCALHNRVLICFLSERDDSH